MQSVVIAATDMQEGIDTQREKNNQGSSLKDQVLSKLGTCYSLS